MNATMTAKATRTVKVETLARVEGEGALLIKMRGDRVQEVKLNIFEPPRLFEGFLRGRHFTEVPDITARICGICPIAYQMSSVHALERALGVEIDPAVRLLRRLFYCGEWIESHALHVYMLHAPDFLGFQDVIEMAGRHRETVEKALRLKKIGNELVALLGGREIHPVSAAVGGFYRVPRKRELEGIRERLRWALEASLETVRFTAGLEFPDFEQDYEFVALSHPEEYPFNEGRIVSNRGIDIDAAQFEDHFVEQHVKHSTSLHAVVRERGSYLVGPLARFNLNFDKLTPLAREAAVSIGLVPPCRNPFKSIIVRAVELVFACEEALRIIDQYSPPAEPRATVAVRAGTGAAATEAPRGLLYHRYGVDEQGLITAARIVPPTSQNLKRMEDDLWRLAPQLTELPLEEITWRCEQAIRNYDPCISCSCHFLKVNIERE
jgi:coenzyme F420-reducing hydrogenase alpha subunit